MANTRNTVVRPPAASVTQDAARPAAEAPEAGETPQTTGTGTSSGDREERIRQAAFRRYLERGGAPGGELEDWLAAEAEESPPGPSPLHE
jgi:hypothetical protein